VPYCGVAVKVTVCDGWKGNVDNKLYPSVWKQICALKSRLSVSMSLFVSVNVHLDVQ